MATDTLKYEDAHKPKIEAVTGIRADRYNAISLKAMDHTTKTGEETSLYLSIEDSSDGASFFFNNPGEAKAFFERCIEGLRYYED